MNATLRALLHGCLLAAALGVFAGPLASGAGLAAGALATLLGCVVAQRLVDRRYRAWVGLVWGAALLGGGPLVAWWICASAALAAEAEPRLLMALSDVPRWGGAGAGLALLLRVPSLRWRAALVLEGGVVVAAVATTVAAHRDGMIARPLAVSDFFWTQGLDPVVAFLALGMAAAVLLANVLARERSLARAALQLGLVLLLGFLVARHIHGQEEASRAQAGGQQESDEEGRARRGQGGRGPGRSGEGRGGSPHQLSDDVPPPQSQRGGKNRPVAVVVFHRTVKPSNGLYYFRHTAFSQFNGVRLVQSTRPDADIDVRQGFPSTPLTLGSAPPPTDQRTEVATDVALLSEHDSVFMLIDPLELSPLVNPDPTRFRRAYHVVSSQLSGPLDEMIRARAGERTWPDELWKHYTSLPSDPRYGELARQLRDRVRGEYRKSALALAWSIKDHLEKTATYSFARRYDDAEDPTAAFLFSTDRRGYCVHLAHSAALLMRALNLPARVSAGYAVPAERLGEGSSLLIKAENAHAWAEVYLRELGWVPIEVTPERTDVESQPFVEKDLQQMLGEMARRRRAAEPPPPPPLPWRTWLAALREALPWALLAALLLAYAVKTWRLNVPRLVRRRRPARAAYRAALDRLSAVGLVRVHGETRERFAARAAALAPAFGPLTDDHLGEALGSRTRPETAPARTAVVVGRQVRAGVPAWRWVLGVLNPVSWMWSR